MRKKLMILGGSRYAIPVIQTAHRLGVEVITADYLPNNPAHRIADEYINVSVTDKAAVLAVAKDRKVNGIISFACDPGVVTAAFVAENLGLPFQCPFASAEILQDKEKFRNFLAVHKFNVPKVRGYHISDYGSVERMMEAIRGDVEYFQSAPLIIKPVDSAGSKGVSKVAGIGDTEILKSFVRDAVEASHSGAIIIEEFLEFEGFHSSSDAFSVVGQVEFITYSDQLFDAEALNAYTPSRIIWQSSMRQAYQEKLTSETQRLFSLLGMKTGIYNIETCASNGIPYLMEVSPRGGGCKIAEILEMAYGIPLIENEIRASVGMELLDLKPRKTKSHWCEMVIHTTGMESGIFDALEIDPYIKEKYVKKIDLGIKRGDKVMPFTGANMAVGDMFLEFDTRKELDDVMDQRKEWMKIQMGGY